LLLFQWRRWMWWRSDCKPSRNHSAAVPVLSTATVWWTACVYVASAVRTGMGLYVGLRLCPDSVHGTVDRVISVEQWYVLKWIVCERLIDRRFLSLFACLKRFCLRSWNVVYQTIFWAHTSFLGCLSHHIAPIVCLRYKKLSYHSVEYKYQCVHVPWWFANRIDYLITTQCHKLFWIERNLISHPCFLKL